MIVLNIREGRPLDRKQIALTGYRLEQYDEIREWLDAQQKPGDPRLTPQVIIQLAFDELLKQKQAGGTVDIAFTDDRIQHAWRRRQGADHGHIATR